MTQSTLYRLLLIPLLLISYLFAQEPVVHDPEVEAYKKEAGQLVSFLEFVMNTVGSAETSAREKETIINESYAKLFRDAQVQIEDDLMENRSAITQKDVQAYLKDVDFFFKEVSFEFTIEDISEELNEMGEMYMRVSISRHLKGTSQKGEPVNTVIPRFIEINIDESMRDMKIVSMYTTKLSRDEEISEWWMGLPYDWKSLFTQQLDLGPNFGMAELRQRTDTVYLEDSVYADIRLISLLSKTTIHELEKLLVKDELDISDNPSLTDLNALAKLSRLKKLNISGTQIRDLTPIRNLTRLEELDCSNSTVRDLSPLKYASNLMSLNASQTRIQDIRVLRNLPLLKEVKLAHTLVSDFSPLADLRALEELDLNNSVFKEISLLENLRQLRRLNLKASKLTNLFSIGQLSSLQTLNIESCSVVDIRPLAQANNLEILQADNSQINSLQPLSSLKNLKKVYCDNTAVEDADARAFMQRNPEVLVVYGSATLLDWWSNMEPAWKAVLKKSLSSEGEPSRDQLQILVNLDRIDLKGQSNIRSLAPVAVMKNLKEIDISGTGILDLSPLADLTSLVRMYADNSGISDLLPLKGLENLQEISFSGTSVASLQALAQLQNLERINADKTSVKSIAALKDLENLKQVYCDGNEISDQEAQEFLQSVPDCLLIFQTARLNQWWDQTTQSWKKVFRTVEYVEEQADRETLHALTQKRSLTIDNNTEIRDFFPLRTFIVLEELSFTRTRVSDLRHLRKLTSLKRLDCSQNPIQDLAPLAYLPQLESLKLDNTPLEKLDALSRLDNLKILSCSGTPLKDLKPLANLTGLEVLDISNTSVRSLRDIQLLFDLKTLTCFNTKLSNAKVDKYKISHPNTDIVFY